MTPWIVYNVAELEQAFATIPDGGRIEIAPGQYERTELTGRAFATGVTVSSAVADDPAVFTDRLILRDVSGVTLETLEVEAGQIASSRNYPRLMVKDSTDVTISDVRIAGHIATADEGQDPFAASTRRLDPIAGYGQDTGLNVQGSTGVTITGVELTDLRLGISISKAHDTTVRDVEIHGVREGININDVRGLLIEDSVFRNFTPWLTGKKSNIDHADMIQFWGKSSTFGVHDLTIRNNVFRQDAGDRETQTIFGHRNTGPDPDITLTNFDIVGNTIINGQLHGISISDVHGVRIRDNVLLPKPDLPDKPDQVDRPTILSGRNTDVEISGNTQLPFSNLRDMRIDNSTGVTVTDDNIILSYDPASPLFWRKVLDQVEAGTWPHGGADHAATDAHADPVPDTPERRLAAAVAAYEAAGMAVVEAVPGKDDLIAPGGGAVLISGGSFNRIREGAGDDVMYGGAGADQFVWRISRTGAERDTILDLDFSDGDVLRLVDTGGSTWIKSDADLSAAIDSGLLAARSNGAGGTELSLAAAPDRVLDLLFHDRPGLDAGLPQTAQTAETPDTPTDGPALDIPADDIPADDAPQDDHTDLTPDSRIVNADTVLQAGRDAGWEVVQADPAGDRLDHGAAATVLVGGESHDWLRGRGQDTILFGGGGGDTFTFDFRSPDHAARHVVLDLDWDTGDGLELLTPDGGHVLQGQADLDRLILNGQLTQSPTDDDRSCLLHVADRPDQQIELLTASALQDALDWIV